MVNKFADKKYIGLEIGDFKVKSITGGRGKNCNAVWALKCKSCRNIIKMPALEAIKSYRLKCSCNEENEKDCEKSEAVKRLVEIRANIINICYNEKSRLYQFYGGHAIPIKVHDEWITSPDKFINKFMGSDITGKYLNRLTIDASFAPGKCLMLPIYRTYEIYAANEILLKESEND